MRRSRYQPMNSTYPIRRGGRSSRRPRFGAEAGGGDSRLAQVEQKQAATRALSIVAVSLAAVALYILASRESRQ